MYDSPVVGFYHWQQRLNIDSIPPLLLSEDVPLFTKFFDVKWKDNQAEALAVLHIDSSNTALNLAPVVFITNEVMKQSSKVQLQQLSTDILSLTDAIFADYRSSSALSLQRVKHYEILQIDCDWTAGSKENYFYFLRLLRQALDPEIVLSSTIRLHQYKDRDTQGIPPVDHGCLMAYNVGNLNEWSTSNSQIDSNITKHYLSNTAQKHYPIPLDIALPYYEWAAVYRNQQLTYLINELSAEMLVDSSRFEQLSSNRYRVIKSTYVDGYYLYAEDLIRLESPDKATLSAVAKQLSNIAGFDGQRLLFYHIGSSITRQTAREDFEKIARLIR